jgi:hypothetical protein
MLLLLPGVVEVPAAGVATEEDKAVARLVVGESVDDARRGSARRDLDPRVAVSGPRVGVASEIAVLPSEAKDHAALLGEADVDAIHEPHGLAPQVVDERVP